MVQTFAVFADDPTTTKIKGLKFLTAQLSKGLVQLTPTNLYIHILHNCATRYTVPKAFPEIRTNICAHPLHWNVHV